MLARGENKHSHEYSVKLYPKSKVVLFYIEECELICRVSTKARENKDEMRRRRVQIKKKKTKKKTTSQTGSHKKNVSHFTTLFQPPC